MKAGFGEADITPPPGTRKIGWLKELVGETIRDPLFVRCAVFEEEGESAAIVQLDLLSIRWSQVAELRRRLEAAYRFPGARVMVTATHNHAGPAVASIGDVRRDERYIAFLLERCQEAFGQALSAQQPARLGFGHVTDFELGHNRRVVMRNGTVKTHGTFADPQALCLEGPVDPEVAVLGAQDKTGRWLGMLVFFTCHPTHLGDGPVFSAGFPGECARLLKAMGIPVPLLINGAAGNVHTSNPVTGRSSSLEEAGRRLAADVVEAVGKMDWSERWSVDGETAVLSLRYRDPTPDECSGTLPGAQRFMDSAIYERAMPGLVARIRERKVQPAEIQVLRLGKVAIVGIPAEYFVELGLRIKREGYPAWVEIAGFTNGMVGYVPTAEAFLRRGYETTLGPPSRLAPEAGDQIAEAAIHVIRQLWQKKDRVPSMVDKPPRAV